MTFTLYARKKDLKTLEKAKRAAARRDESLSTLVIDLLRTFTDNIDAERKLRKKNPTVPVVP